MGGSGGDTNNYLIGHKEYSNSGVNVTSTTFGNILNITGLGTAGGYHLTGFAVFSMNQNAGAGEFTWTNGSGTINTSNGYQYFIATSGAITFNTILGPAAGPSIAAQTFQIYQFDWHITMSNAGNILIQGKETTSGDSWQVSSIFCKVEPY
jgi:hypothetical protein